MQLRIRATGQVMYESELRSYLKANNGPSYDLLTPEVMEAVGVDPVLEGPQAFGGTVYQYGYRNGVEQIDGKWYTKYVLGPVFVDTPEKTAAEQEAEYKAMKDAEQANNVRQTRDEKLKECDWRVIKALESNIPQDFEWAAYRQALRDVPTQAGFPWTVNWPDTP
jgi:hypothetical protein